MLAELRAELAASDDMPEEDWEMAQAMLRELEEIAENLEDDR
jgi:hypothetical protein